MNLQKHVSLNINVRGLGESPTLAINERVKLLQGQGKKIYNFGLGQSPFPVPAPVVEALRLHAHEKDYLPVKGYGAVIIQHYMLYLYDIPSGYFYPYHAFSLSVYSRKEFAGELLLGQLKYFSC